MGTGNLPMATCRVRSRRALLRVPLTIALAVVASLSLVVGPSPGLAPVAAAASAPGANMPTWLPLSPDTSPGPRDSPAVAFDSATDQLLLFGGRAATGNFGDTWTWDGSNWIQRSPVASPSPRNYAAMAYDQSTRQLILFGGSSAGGPLGDTWLWTGTTWDQLSPAASPPARAFASMAYDQATGQLILFGGRGTDGAALGDTWSWTGSTWAQLAPSTSPTARSFASLAYDRSRSSAGLILFGGSTGPGPTYLGDTWAWDGTNWADLAPATSPPVRDSASMADDPSTGQLTLFGGSDGGNHLGDTWEWDGSTWAQLAPTTSPPARYSAPLTYDTGTDQLVLFGGNGATGTKLDDTWLWGTRTGPSHSAAAGARLAGAPDGIGYWITGPGGSVATFGGAGSYGSLEGQPLNQPVVGMAATPDGQGYWLVAADGGVFTFGDAGF
ncbi:MAG TPA: kelch repeat-containing protein, partial [Acidimicrobiales bacterium]